MGKCIDCGIRIQTAIPYPPFVRRRCKLCEARYKKILEEDKNKGA